MTLAPGIQATSTMVLNLETIEERDAAGNTLPSTSIWYSDDFFAADSHFGAMTKNHNGYGGEVVFVSDHRGGGDSAHIVSLATEKYGVVDLVDQTWGYVGVDWDESGGSEIARLQGSPRDGAQWRGRETLLPWH